MIGFVRAEKGHWTDGDGVRPGGLDRHPYDDCARSCSRPVALGCLRRLRPDAQTSARSCLLPQRMRRVTSVRPRDIESARGSDPNNLKLSTAALHHFRSSAGGARPIPSGVAFAPLLASGGTRNPVLAHEAGDAGVPTAERALRLGNRRSRCPR
jgi:hypothetical protein